MWFGMTDTEYTVNKAVIRNTQKGCYNSVILLFLEEFSYLTNRRLFRLVCLLPSMRWAELKIKSQDWGLVRRKYLGQMCRCQCLLGNCWRVLDEKPTDKGKITVRIRDSGLEYICF
jgi:hypothetical protein